MPLISCPDCLGKLSTEAARCPSCGRPNAARSDEAPASWSQPSPYAAESAASYGSAGGSYATAVEAPVAYAAAPPPPQELECPICRLRQKNRTFCSFCDERLVEPRFNPPHHFPRVPIDYADFGYRFGASALDGMVFALLYGAFRWLHIQDPTSAALGMFAWTIVYCAYYVGFTAATGQTPGKMVMGIQVRRADGGTVGLREASLRYLPNVVFTVTIVVMASLIAATPGGVDDLDGGAQVGIVGAVMVGGLLQLLYLAYILGEIICFYASPRNRALHDFLAGTVVVHKA
jgi:uncharacterized RDD family membrane protein YckC